MLGLSAQTAFVVPLPKREVPGNTFTTAVSGRAQKGKFRLRNHNMPPRKSSRSTRKKQPVPRSPSPEPPMSEEELNGTPVVSDDDGEISQADWDAELDHIDPPFSVLHPDEEERLVSLGKRSKRPISYVDPPSPPSKRGRDSDPVEPPQARPTRKRQRSKSPDKPPAKRGKTHGTWIEPKTNMTHKFREFDLTLDNHELPHVNWWDPVRRYPRTMRQLVELEANLGTPVHPQMARWNVLLGRAPTAEFTSDQLDRELVVELIEEPGKEDRNIPGTAKQTPSERVAARILAVAKKQIERRDEATRSRLKKEKFERGGHDNRAAVAPSDTVVALPPAQPPVDSSQEENPLPGIEEALPDVPLATQVERLVTLVNNSVLGGSKFPEELYNPPEQVLGDDISDEVADSILSVTPIDDRRKYFANKYRKLKPIDFRLQVHMPSWVTEEHLELLLQRFEEAGHPLSWVGIPGDYRVIVDMKDAPHDAAYSYAHQNREGHIDQHTRQWFLTINFNKTRAQLINKYGSPEALSRNVELLLSTYDPEIVRHTLPSGGDFPMPLGAIRQWKILFSESEVAPRTGYWHMHVLVSVTYIRFGQMQVRLNYPRLTSCLQKICDVAYFHALAVKTPFSDDLESNPRDMKRLRDYIEKNRGHFTEENAENMALSIQKEGANRKGLQR